jgi:hypothetical protein
MPRLPNGQRSVVPKTSHKISRGSGANARQNSFHCPLFSKNNRFNQEKTVQISSRLIPGKNQGYSSPFARSIGTRGPDYDPKKVSKIRG